MPPTYRNLVSCFGLVACLALVAGSTVGCFGGSDRKPKASTSAIWIGNNSEALTPSTLARLKDAGIEEAYVAAARFRPDAAEVLETYDFPEMGGSSLPVTLAIRGSWQESSVEEAQTLAELVGEAAEKLRFDVESRGILVVGIHFDFPRVSSFEGYAAFLQAIHGKLSKDLFLSLTVHRDWIEKEGLSAVTDEVDFVVPFLYGQRVSERDSGDAWDFVELERRLRLLEKLDVPYQLGVITLGTAALIGGDNTLKARTTRRAMLDLLRDPALKLRPGFSFHGVNRRVYTMSVEKAATLGDWEAAEGDTVRMVRVATSDLEELMRLVDVWGLPNHLGQLFYRLPSTEEGLSVHSDSLLLAFDPEPASPDIHFEVSLQRRTGRGHLLRFSLVNRNREFTELALLENNYLQIISETGEFSKNVRTGDFTRFEMLSISSDGKIEQDHRNPNMLRLYAPILEGLHTTTTGNIEIEGRAEPVLVLEASFLLPDGRTLKVGPRRWSKGSFEDEQEDR